MEKLQWFLEQFRNGSGIRLNSGAFIPPLSLGHTQVVGFAKFEIGSSCRVPNSDLQSLFFCPASLISESTFALREG